MFNWLSNIWGHVTNTFDDVKHAIATALTAVWSKLVDVFGPVHSAWDDMLRGGAVVGQLLASIAQAVYKLARWITTVGLPAVYHAALRAVADARDWVTGLLSDLQRWIQGALASLWSFAKDIPGWVLSNVWTPLRSLIDGAVRWVTQTVIPWLRGLIDDVLRWATEAIRGVWQVLSQAWRWIVDAGTFLEHVVRGALSWLLLMGRYTVDFFTTLIDMAKSIGTGGLVAMLLSGFQSQGSSVEDWLSKWFGM